MPLPLLLEFVPFEKRYKYPHMMPEDRAIWERFIDANPMAFEMCAYDVPVGSVPEFDTTVNAESGGNAEKLYKKKIDVVAFKGEVLFIIELKPKAGTGTIGQVKGYRTLFKRDYNPKQILQAMIITDEMRPDMEFLAEEERVQILIA